MTVYPFIAINRDPRDFTAPNELRLNRSSKELGQILSWSAGPHACPAKELSIFVTVMMLDALAAKCDLRALKIYSLEF